jgi:hypothetical protein
VRETAAEGRAGKVMQFGLHDGGAEGDDPREEDAGGDRGGGAPRTLGQPCRTPQQQLPPPSCNHHVDYTLTKAFSGNVDGDGPSGFPAATAVRHPHYTPSRAFTAVVPIGIQKHGGYSDVCDHAPQHNVRANSPPVTPHVLFTWQQSSPVLPTAVVSPHSFMFVFGLDCPIVAL